MITTADMESIEYLSISGLSAVEDIDGIQYAVNLQILNMTGDIKNVDKIKGLTNLRRLTINSNEFLTDLSQLGSKPELTLLNVDDCTELTSLQGITGKNYPKLEELSCSSCSSLSDISALSGPEIPTLKEADFGDSAAITDIAPLEGYDAMEELDIEKVDITEENREGYRRAIRSLTNLNALQMTFCNITDEDTEMFSTLQNLQTLVLNMNDLTSTDFCNQLPQKIEVLSLHGNDIEEMGNLDRLTNLTILGMGDNNVTDFSFISKLTSLTNGDIRHAEGTESFPCRETYYYGSQSEPIEIKDGQVVIENPYIGVNGNPVSFEGAEIVSTDDVGVTVSYDAAANEITLGKIPSRASVNSITIEAGYNLPVSNGEYKVTELRIVTYVKEKTHEHIWGSPTYTWSADGKTCTKGETTYTAVFESDWAVTQTKVLEDVEMIPHSYGAEWESDETDHWHMCAVCKAKADEESHTFEWIVDKEATDEQSGSRHQECTVCGYALAAVEIPPLEKPEEPEQPIPPQTEKPAAQPSRSTTPQTGDAGNSCLGHCCAWQPLVWAQPSIPRENKKIDNEIEIQSKIRKCRLITIFTCDMKKRWSRGIQD